MESIFGKQRAAESKQSRGGAGGLSFLSRDLLQEEGEINPWESISPKFVWDAKNDKSERKSASRSVLRSAKEDLTLPSRR